MERLSLEERYSRREKRHPWIYESFKRRALEYLYRGETRISGKLIMEELRRDFGPSIDGADRFKIDNSLTSLDVRRLLKECPQFEGVIETRKRKGETVKFHTEDAQIIEGVVHSTTSDEEICRTIQYGIHQKKLFSPIS